MKTFALLVASVGLGSSLLAAACGGSSGSSLSAGDGGGGDGSTAADGGPSQAKAATDLGTAYCTRAAECAPAYVTEGFGDMATCVSRFAQQFEPTFMAPGGSLTVSQAEACAAALPSASCGQLVGRQLPTACAAIPGALSAGSACGADSQCVGTRCRVAPNSLCGICTTPAPAGAACGVDDDCQPGMTCLKETCVTYGDEGASCSATAPCRPDLGCVSGTCGTPLGAGSPCNGDGQCDGLHAVVCNGQSGKCEVASFTQAGAACGLVDGGFVACQGPGGLCAGVTPPTYLGTCLAHAADGASCDTDAGPLCAFGAVCASGKCQVPDPSSCK